jgi:hypothetical protein
MGKFLPYLFIYAGGGKDRRKKCDMNNLAPVYEFINTNAMHSRTIGTVQVGIIESFRPVCLLWSRLGLIGTVSSCRVPGSATSNGIIEQIILFILHYRRVITMGLMANDV